MYYLNTFYEDAFTLVYFLEKDDRVKIGITSQPESRLPTLDRNHGPFEIALVLTGGRMLETALHKRFKANLIKNEWFFKQSDLAEFINEHRMTEAQVFEALAHFQRNKKVRSALYESINERYKPVKRTIDLTSLKFGKIIGGKL